MFIDLPLTQSQAREPFDIADLTCLLVCAGQVVLATIRLTVINICIEYPELSVYIGNNPLSLFTDLCPASARMGLATPLPCCSLTGDLTTTQTLLKLLLM